MTTSILVNLALMLSVIGVSVTALLALDRRLGADAEHS